MKITIFDYNKNYTDVANRFIEANPEFSYINVQHTDIKYVKCDVLVTAGNSFGVMSGGIDLVVNQLMNVESKVQSIIQNHHNGVLPVGNAISLYTNYDNIRFLIYAPTMFIPTQLPERTDNPLMATIAAMSRAKDFKQDVSVYIPVLCVNSGGVNPIRAISQMCLGIDMVMKRVSIKTDEDMINNVYNRIANFKY